MALLDFELIHENLKNQFSSTKMRENELQFLEFTIGKNFSLQIPVNLGSQLVNMQQKTIVVLSLLASSEQDCEL